MSKKKKIHNIDKLEEILNRNCDAAENAVSNTAIAIFLKAKHGRARGILCRNPPYQVTEKDVEIAKLELAPLIEEIRKDSVMSFARVFNGILGDKGCKNYFYAGAAASLGKKGGKARGSIAPHTVWLDNAMKEIKRECDDELGPFTVTYCFNELLRRPDIDGIDDDNRLWFKKSALEGMGYIDGKKEPTISRNMVEKALTRLNKAL